MLIWILGSEGLLGREMQKCLQKKSMPYFATNHKEADISELEKLKAILKEKKPTHIINCSAYNKVDEAETNEEVAFKVNAQGPENLGVLALPYRLRVLHVSTDYVFDGKKKTPYLESDLCHPLNVYGKSKLEGERRLFHHFPEACVVRTSWLFGKGGINFISHLPKLLRANEEIAVDDKQISRPTYCVDLAELLVELLPKSGLFHFTSGRIGSRYQIAQDMLKMCRALHIPVKCHTIKPLHESVFKAPRPLYSVLESEQIAEKKGRSWDQVLKEFLKNA